MKGVESMGSRATWMLIAGLLASSAAPAATPAQRVLREAVVTLADSTMEGRGVGTAGLDSAAAWIAARRVRMGLRPGGDAGSYFQSLDITTGVRVGDPCTIELAGSRHSAGDRFQPIGFSTNGSPRAPVVFAGYGISAPGFDYDDYAGLDVRDKLVLVLSNEPGEMDSLSRFDGSINTAHAELRTKAINAREHGALGLLVAPGPRYHRGEPLRGPRPDGAGYMTSGLVAAWISEEVADGLLRSSGWTLAALQESIDATGRPRGIALSETASVAVTLKRSRAKIRNVVGWIPGSDTSRTIVIGAHYDHLGYGGESSLSPDERRPHRGADDNASGVAALLGVADLVADGTLGENRPAARTGPLHNLVFCAFTGEEMGLVGSGHFVDDPVRPLETVEAMINMDMVGRLRDNKLMVMGAGTATEFPPVLEAVNREVGKFTLRTSEDGFGPSDHSSFYKRKVPVLMLFTGAHADYHKPSDTWDKLNLDGLERITRFAAALTETLDARPKVAYRRATADSTMGRIAGGGGYGSYLGTIPDYLQTEGGVLLSGVRSKSPADQAGLRAGDVIVRFDGVRVDNIYDYTFALRSRKPGQQVRISVKRGEGEVELLATLGRRP